MFTLLSIALGQAACTGRNPAGGAADSGPRPGDARDLGVDASGSQGDDGDDVGSQPERLAHPSLSKQEIKIALATAKRNLLDGDLTRPCERILDCYTHDNDHIGICGGPPTTMQRGERTEPITPSSSGSNACCLRAWDRCQKEAPSPSRA